MCGTPVHGFANIVNVMLIGQAPGPHEADRGKPFAHTAGQTLFKWLNEATNKSEDELRNEIYFAAVARCYPGKNPKGAGDRVPTKEEIENCRSYLAEEVKILKPKIILPVGKLAIGEVLGPTIFKKTTPLEKVIGQKFFVTYHGEPVTVIPLPHPSGVSRWHQTDPGKKLLKKALSILKNIS